MSTKPTALGCYIFAGGFTTGIKKAGFKVLGHLEGSMFGVRTVERNHPELQLGKNIFIDPPTWPIHNFNGVDLIFGNPPCAPFSVANASSLREGRTQWMRDPRVECIRNEFNLLGELRPKVLVFESVQQAFTRGRDLIDSLTDSARELGYSATYILLNTAHLGVPQTRRRFFCVFHNVVIPWWYPAAEAKDGTPRHELTVREAFDELEDLAPEIYQDTPSRMRLAKLTPEGDSLRKTWEAENPERTWKRGINDKVIGRPPFTLRKLAWDRPSPTLIGGAQYYHPGRSQHLSVKETQVLCGYPPEYEFVTKTLGLKYTEIGQAVMPPVGEWLGKNIKRAVEINVHLPDRDPQLIDFETGRRTL